MKGSGVKATEERARRVLLTVDLATENGFERARRAIEAVHAERFGRCAKHHVALVPGEKRAWCVACLDELAHGPLASTGMIGRTLEETEQRLLGMVELRRHQRERGANR